MSVSSSTNDIVADMALPSTFRKLVVTKLTKKFREAVVIKTVPMLKAGPNEVVVRNRFVGINATDINKTAGMYGLAMEKSPPFDVGFEGVGEVVDIGKEVTNVKIGQSVCFMCVGGAYAEYILLHKAQAIPIPSVKPEYSALLVSGLTADLALKESGRLQKGETVLVTAAAGGTGQLAVQYAKLAGCHVIGTCSSESKATFLKSIGCDRAIIYTTENLHDVLRKEYPKKLDVVYECVGGETFEKCLNWLAPKGRMIIIGFVSAYKEDSNVDVSTLKQWQMMTVLTNSLSVSGFFLHNYRTQWGESFARQAELFAKGSVKITVDNGKNSEKGPFKGIEAIADAIDFLYTRKSQGKVVVEINDALPTAGL